MDDGSKDETAAVVEAFAASSSGSVRYFYQQNRGRPHALNKGIREARGQLFTILDDDDAIATGALGRIHDEWESVPSSQRRGALCGLVGLCADSSGKVIGDPFPVPGSHANYFETRYVAEIGGDKTEVVRTELIEDFQFQPAPGERRVPTSLLWFTLSRDYQMRLINDVWSYKEYQVGGMTDSILTLRVNSAASSAEYYLSLLKLFPNIPLRSRLKLLINGYRFLLHGGRRAKHLKRPRDVLGAPAFAMAVVFWLRDLQTINRRIHRK